MTSPAIAPQPKAPQQDARGFLFQVLAADGLTWLEIELITEFSVDRSEGEEEAETTTFGDNGNYKSEKMQRGATCELTQRRGSAATETAGGTRAALPGRARVEALDRLLGTEGIGLFRFRHAWEQAWEVWDAWVGLGEVSGETNDKAEWECTWHRWGEERFFDKDSGARLNADGTPYVA